MLRNGNKMIKKHMTKAQIKRAKTMAKARKNRRLSDAEAARLLNNWDFNDNKNFNGIEGGEIYDTNYPHSTKPLQVINDKPTSALLPALESSFKASKKEPAKIILNGQSPDKSSNKLEALIGDITKRLEMVGINTRMLEGNKKGRKLSKKQFNALMKKAGVVLGINDDKETLPVLDVNSYTKYTIDERVELVLSTLDYASRQEIRKEYNKVIKSKKIRKNKDKLAVLSHLYLRPQSNIPMCLLDKKYKINKVRKILKPKGDIKQYMPRIVPDKTYMNEICGKPKTKFDAFDKLDNDKKIEWARYANLVLNITDTENITRINLKHIDTIGLNTIMFAMSYACKMSKISEFSGIFNSPHWILYRVHKFYNSITNKEYNVFYDMALDYLGINNKKTIPAINEKEAVVKLIPTLKKMKLYGRYQKLAKNRRSPLQIIRELVLNG